MGYQFMKHEDENDTVDARYFGEEASHWSV
jgi:hypothetical protein